MIDRDHVDVIVKLDYISDILQRQDGVQQGLGGDQALGGHGQDLPRGVCPLPPLGLKVVIPFWRREPGGVCRHVVLETIDHPGLEPPLRRQLLLPGPVPFPHLGGPGGLQHLPELGLECLALWGHDYHDIVYVMEELVRQGGQRLVAVDGEYGDGASKVVVQAAIPVPVRLQGLLEPQHPPDPRGIDLQPVLPGQVGQIVDDVV
jgi:hypothetical protein